VVAMVAGEPDDVRVKFVDGEWAVQIVEKGEAAQHLFKNKAIAEAFAEVERWRLGLPGKPPVDDIA
jgi:hypothetical protein